MKKIIALIICTTIAFISIKCGKTTDEITAGSICTIEDGAGKFGIVKVLVINDNEAHIKIYKNKYDQRPEKVDLKTLGMGGIGDKDGFGIGHVPLKRSGFEAWKPKVVASEPVTEDDLSGYKMWQSQ